MGVHQMHPTFPIRAPRAHVLSRPCPLPPVLQRMCKAFLPVIIRTVLRWSAVRAIRKCSSLHRGPDAACQTCCDGWEQEYNAWLSKECGPDIPPLPEWRTQLYREAGEHSASSDPHNAC